MIIFLHGDDPFLVGRRKHFLVEAFRAKNPEAEVLTFDFEDERSPDGVRRALAACEGGLFAGKKMVIMLHPFLLEENAGQALVDFLKGATLKQYPENVYLWVQPGKIKKTHPLAKALGTTADKVEELPALLVARGSKKVPDTRALLALAKKEAASLGASFAPQAAEDLIALTGADTARLVSEVEKLAVYKSGGTIESGDIDLLSGQALATDVFQALEALASDDKEQALRLFRTAARGEDIYGALALCAWQVRRMLVVRELMDQGRNNAYEIAGELKMAPFLVQKTLPTLRRFPLSRLKAGLELLADLDLELKTGQITPDLALDTFVWKF